MISNLWKKYKEIFFYGIFGVGATVINIASYQVFAKICGIPYLVANVLAWILAFIFAFITNKLFVFESKSWGRSVAMKEFLGFLSARLATGILDTALMFTFNDDRGTLVQLVHEGYKQMNVVTSKKGVFRGGHYHKMNREVFYIISGHFKFTA